MVSGHTYPPGRLSDLHRLERRSTRPPVLCCMQFVREGALTMASARFHMLCSLVLLASPSSRVVSAQGLATLRGVITDASGAVVPDAAITLTQASTRQARTVTSSNDGNYLIPALPPADYTLVVQAKGFRQSTREGITLLADQSATIDVRMEVGDATQTVTVDEAFTHVDTSTGTQSQVINQTQM